MKNAFVRWIWLIAGFILASAFSGYSAAAFGSDDPPEGIFADHWYDVRLSGQRIGYMNITQRRDGDTVYTHTKTFMEMARAGIGMEIRSNSEALETLAGEPLRFSSVMEMGSQPVRVSGEMRDGRVFVEMEQGGMRQQSDYILSGDAVMSWGMERIMRAMGTEPGTVVEVNLYSPDIRVESTVPAKITVIGPQAIDFFGKATETTEYTTRLGIGEMELVSRSWVDGEGVMVRTLTPFGGMEMDMWKVSNQVALEPFFPPEIFESSLLPVATPVPADSRAVIYRMARTDNGSLRPHLIEHATQMVEFVSDSEAMITVLRPDFSIMARSTGDDDISDESYFRANLYINSDDPLIRQLAEQAIGEDPLTDEFAKADRLRRFVTDFIDDKNLSVGFATASEVARQPEGDCTEHAVLLAALGRASGIPARVVCGIVVFTEDGSRETVAGYHMWTQFFINGRWIDLDSAFDETECAPIRIAFYESSLDNTAMNEMSFMLLDVLGRIELGVDLVH